MITGQILPQTGKSADKLSFPVCCAACQQTKDMLSVGDAQGVDVHPHSHVLMLIFSCLVVVGILNLVLLEASSQLWKNRMDSHSGSMTIAIALNGPSLRQGQAWGKAAHGHICCQGKPQEKNPTSNYRKRKWVTKIHQQLSEESAYMFNFPEEPREGSLSLCLWPGDWRTLWPCQVCLGLDVLTGKLELLSETIIQFLSSVQLMAFI